jgi:flagellar P-ring protein FlgI
MNGEYEGTWVRGYERMEGSPTPARTLVPGGSLGGSGRSGAGWWRWAVVLGLCVFLPRPAAAQEFRVRDLTVTEQTVPVRLMGYGLVVGLDGTGDRPVGGQGSHTVQSVANVLRRFDIEVPAAAVRTRNAAAVLVTAELNPYLRPGGRFEVKVSSLGDARSLRGGVLWMTPLVADVGGQAVAAAQGALLLSEGGMAARRNAYVVETTASIPDGGVLELELPRPAFAAASRLLLREPDLTTASRIADAINQQIGPDVAAVEDPGSISLTLGAGAERIAALTRIGDLRVQPDRPARLVINGRDGTVVAGGDVRVGAAVVSHGVITLSIGGGGNGGGGPGNLRMEPGTSVQEIAAALHAVQAPPTEIGAIFQSLREVGAISAEVVIR